MRRCQERGAIIVAVGGIRLNSLARDAVGYDFPNQLCPIFERETFRSRPAAGSLAVLRELSQGLTRSLGSISTQGGAV
jgi:hypothetical protein